ncbi:hypothetical protein PSTG_12960 [Puccinia striiformis f. sp. tritici PST-78]|uniref:Hydrophobin n=1 Tax=Puccinia striiformis f. sp. tritici PST-78 TaxID=1165861 RepID=A0A0L0V3W2_9BASI|nr:hypothetical protein PSTG_12960 [Puccinia striiformis f. sp. tritici PST-78]
MRSFVAVAITLALLQSASALPIFDKRAQIEGTGKGESSSRSLGGCSNQVGLLNLAISTNTHCGQNGLASGSGGAGGLVPGGGGLLPGGGIDGLLPAGGLLPAEAMADCSDAQDVTPAYCTSHTQLKISSKEELCGSLDTTRVSRTATFPSSQHV